MAPNEGLAGNSIQALIPEIFSKKVALAYSEITDFPNLFANDQWEGEIKSQGDTVHIVLPDPTGLEIVDGDACPQLQAVSYESTALTIDKQKTFAFAITDKEKAQTQFKRLEDAHASMIAHKMSIVKSKEMMKSVLSDANAPTATGETMTTIGTSVAAETVNVDNVYDLFVDIKMGLFKKGAVDARGKYPFEGENQEMQEESARVVIGTELAALLLKCKQLTHPTANGDIVIEEGTVKRVAGLEIVVDTAIDEVAHAEVSKGGMGLAATVLPLIAGTKNGITKASQISKVETIRDPRCFQDIVRGMELYGYKILHPAALVRGFVTIGEV